MTIKIVEMKMSYTFRTAHVSKNIEMKLNSVKWLDLTQGSLHFIKKKIQKAIIFHGTRFDPPLIQSKFVRDRNL